MTDAPGWRLELADEFEPEFSQFSLDVQDALLAAARSVEIAGPRTGRPHVDTLHGSKHTNMKELRFDAENGTQIWRAAFAFDSRQVGLILIAAAKQGKGQRRFYVSLIKIADKRFDAHIDQLKAAKRRG